MRTCPKGHEIAGENARVVRRPGRNAYSECRRCKKENREASEARLRAASDQAVRDGVSIAEQLRAIADRFWANVERGDGCWLWRGGSFDAKGYGLWKALGRCWRAPRVAWMLTNGDLSPELDACHECDNPPCVRPDHLFPGTNLENMRDCAAKGRIKPNKGAHQRARTHCVHGHEFTADNTYTTAEGWRRCRRCNADGQARKAAANRVSQ